MRTSAPQQNDHQRKAKTSPDMAARVAAQELALCQAAVEICKSLHLQCRLALADTPAVAWGVAHYGGNAIGEPMILPHRHGIVGGKIVSGEVIGGEVTGDQTISLLTLPVEALRIDEPTTETLSRLGITTIGQCLRLPRGGLASRLGRPLIRRLDHWTGDRHESITIHDLPAEIAAQWDLQYPTDDLEIIGDRMRRLVEKVSAGLANDGRGALRFAVRLDLTDHPPLTLDVGLFAPSRELDHLHELLMHRIDGHVGIDHQTGSASKMHGEVTAIRLAVIAAAAMQCEQNLLFEVGLANDAAEGGRAWRADSTVARLIDLLACRVGRDDVVEILPSPDPVPEDSYEAPPLAGNLPAANHHWPSQVRGQQASRKTRSSRSNRIRLGDQGRRKRHASGRNADPVMDRRRSSFRGGFGPAVGDAMRRPLTLLDRPTRLIVDGLCERDVPPQTPTQIANDDVLGKVPPRIRIAGIFHRVTRAWGPERIESNWWKGQAICREYYRIETDRGLWLWIFQDADGHWFLHGRF